MAQSLELVPVFTGTLQSQPVQLCDARTLHAFMLVPRDFSNWIKGRIKKFDFVEGVDFITVKNLSSPDLASAKSRAQTLTDYHLTLGMAKELSMVENNAKGKEARRYFIDQERLANHLNALKPPVSNPERIAYTVGPNDALSAAQAEQLRLIFSNRCGQLPKDSQAGFMTKGWSKMKSHFGCTYRQIPQREFSEAVSLATRHAAEWSAAAALPAPIAPVGMQRWLTTINAQGTPTVESVSMDALVVTPDELPMMLLHDRRGITDMQAQKIAMHANLRVMGEMCERKTRTDFAELNNRVRELPGYELCELMTQGYMELGLRNTGTDGRDMVTGKRPDETVVAA